MLACNSRNGKWCRTFHQRFGAKITNATTPPIHNHRFASSFRWFVSSSPRTIPAPKIIIEYLFSRPMPATTPNQIHSLSFPVLMMRITRYAQVIQNSGSNAFIVKMLSNPRMPGAVSVVIAASTCAKRLPPSSRAISAVSTTSTAPASAGKNRIASSD